MEFPIGVSLRPIGRTHRRFILVGLNLDLKSLQRQLALGLVGASQPLVYTGAYSLYMISAKIARLETLREASADGVNKDTPMSIRSGRG